MKKLILTIYTLLYIGLVQGQLQPNQKSELAINQERNFLYNAKLRTKDIIGKRGVIQAERIPFSVYPTEKANLYSDIINGAFDLMHTRVDLSILNGVPIHFYFVTQVPISARRHDSSIPWAYGFYDDLIHSGAVSYTRLDPYNFDRPDYRIVIYVPKYGFDREALIASVLKGIARILHEATIGPDDYWDGTGHGFISDGRAEQYAKYADLSRYASTSNKAFIAEYFAIKVMHLENDKVPEQETRNLLDRIYAQNRGPKIGHRI